MATPVEFARHAGSRVSKKAVAAIGPRLFELRERGVLTPEAVVEDAREEDSPLHPFFEWDDTAAAERFRLDQARYLIRSVNVVVAREGGGEPMSVRAFVSIGEAEDAGRKYIGTMTAMNNPAHRREVVARALEELEHWRARYELFSELSDIFAAMDSVRKKRKKRAA